MASTPLLIGRVGLRSLAAGETACLSKSLSTSMLCRRAFHGQSAVATRPALPSIRHSRTLRRLQPPSPSVSSLHRSLSSSTPARQGEASQKGAAQPSTQEEEPLATYAGPMAKTLRRLKTFSLGSLFITALATPVFIFTPVDLSMGIRAGICLAAISTSAAGNALVAWMGAPYVGRMELVSKPRRQTATIASPASPSQKAVSPAIDAYTLTWRLQTLRTTIFEPSFIRPTKKSFSSWELPDNPGPVFDMQGQEAGATSGAAESQEKILVAETANASTGKVVGRLWAERVPGTATRVEGESGEFKQEARCFAEGKPVRAFQVHEELLSDEWRILG